jgi:hypothetical protein
MPRSTRQRVVFVLGVLSAVSPIVFGLLRGLNAHDLRYLWVALATGIGVAVVMLPGSTRRRDSIRVIGLAIAALIVGALFGAVAAHLEGVRAGPGMLVVVCAFALAWAAGLTLCLSSSVQRSPVQALRSG